MTQEQLNDIYEQSKFELSEKLKLADEYSYQDPERLQLIENLHKIHDYNIKSLKHFGTIEGLDTTIID